MCVIQSTYITNGCHKFVNNHCRGTTQEETTQKCKLYELCFIDLLRIGLYITQNFDVTGYSSEDWCHGIYNACKIPVHVINGTISSIKYFIFIQNYIFLKD